MVDVKTITYEVEFITESGTRYVLDGALLRFQWEEQISELAQRATITVANRAMGSSWLHKMMKINCIVIIWADWGEGKQEVFEGTIWDWNYTSSTQKELQVTCYDHMIRLQQSRGQRYFSAGMTTRDMLANICEEWGIPLRYEWSQSITHEKKVFNATRISDMVLDLLEEVRRKAGHRYVATFRSGELIIKGIGENESVYLFDTSVVESTNNQLTINNLVTRVIIIGQQDDAGRAPVEAVVDGDLRFGTLQEVLRRGNDKTLEAAQAEAQAVIDERGQPEEVVKIDTPIVPFIRKGDLVEVRAGNLIDFFWVEAVSHDGMTRRSILTLEREQEPPVEEQTLSTRTHTVVRGDTLTGIARQFYGDGRRHGEIYAANADAIEAEARRRGMRSSSNGHWIFPGTVLVIP